MHLYCNIILRKRIFNVVLAAADEIVAKKFESNRKGIELLSKTEVAG